MAGRNQFTGTIAGVFTSASDGNDEIQLRRYLSVFWRRKLVIAAAVGACGLLAVGLSLRQPNNFRASAEVLLQPSVTEDVFAPDSDAAAQTSSRSRIQTSIAVMTSRSVELAVEEELGFEPKVSISQQGETDVVAIIAVSRDREKAATVAQTYAEVYENLSKDRLVGDLLDAAGKVQVELDAVTAQIKAIEAPLIELDQAVLAAPLGEAREAAQAASDAARQQSAGELGGLRSRVENYSAQLDELRLSSQVIETGGVQIVSDAEIPERRFSPKPKTNLAMGIALGLIIGVVLAFVREHFDDRLTTKDDVAGVAGGLGVLAVVPASRSSRHRLLRRRRRPTVVSITAPTSMAAEGWRGLRTSVQYLGVGRALKILLVTSPNEGEGTSQAVANLAVTLARAGQRVVVVDGNLRRAQLHTLFGLPNDVGLSSVLSGQKALPDVIKRLPGDSSVAVVTAGPLPPNPSELLSTRRTREIFEMLAIEADFVIVEGPPVIPVTDSSILSAAVDGVALVVAARSTTQRSLALALELLDQVGAPMVGTVLTGAARPRRSISRPDGRGATGGQGRHRNGQGAARNGHGAARTADQVAAGR